MDNASLLTVAMAERCRHLLLDSGTGNRALPRCLQHSHLLWMCEKIETNAEEWPATKLHRWIGFLQAAMVAHKILDLDRAKAMFNKAKVAHSSADDEMSDHLDLATEFILDIGGEA
jgi:hypothetical protein